MPKYAEASHIDLFSLSLVVDMTYFVQLPDGNSNLLV
jgi:hypothetical protein